MRIHLKILKTPIEKTRTKVSKLIDELREGLVFQGKKLWSVVFRKILLLIDEGSVYSWVVTLQALFMVVIQNM